MSKIRFCPKCDNNFSNYNLETDDTGQPRLFYKCESCQYVEEVLAKDLPNHAAKMTQPNLQMYPLVKPSINKPLIGPRK